MEIENVQIDTGTGADIARVSHSIGKYDLEIENDLLKCRVYWARMVGRETESLFTQYTKHTFYEIQYALEGRIVMKIGECDQVSIEPSEFIVIPPDTIHQIIDGDNIGVRFIMAFSLEVKGLTIEKLPRELSLVTPRKETKHMRRLLEIIVERKYHDEAVRRRLITDYLECFMLEFIEAVMPYRGGKSSAGSKMSENEHRVAQVERFISDYNGIGISIDDVANFSSATPFTA